MAYRWPHVWIVVLVMAAFFALSMAEGIAMPRDLKGETAVATTNMPDCDGMKMPMPCKDPDTLCLGAVCIPLISFLAPMSSPPAVQAWTRNIYEGRLAAVLYGRTIVPALEPPIRLG